MKKILGASLACVAGLWFMPAMADSETRPYVTGGYDYVYDDGDRVSDDGDGLWIGGGLAVSEFWGLEASSFYNEFDRDTVGGNRWKEVGVKLDSLFFASREAWFSPYFGVGLGVMESTLRDPNRDSTDPFADIGLGFFTYAGFLRDIDLGLRFDLRYRVVNPDIIGVDKFGETVARIGLVLPLGDRDTASDATPASSEPAAAAADKGKADGKDSDGDGVTDDKDSCPGTARGLTVDAKGCPVNAAQSGPNRSFENVNFAYDKDALTDYAKATLDSTASAISGLTAKYPKLKVDVSGHTDWVGTDAYNQALSERRANAVKGYLVRKGVEEKRISTFSYGESKPAATNDTEEGRAINRRSEIRTHE